MSGEDEVASILNMMSATLPDTPPFSLTEVQALRDQLNDAIWTTPVWEWAGPTAKPVCPSGGSMVCKLELLQVTGSFKPRGALAVMLALAPETLARGVIAVSTGNHGIAVAYGAQRLGTSATVVMMQSASPARVAACQAYGATVVLVDTIHAAYTVAQQRTIEEGKTLIHPFEGPRTALGTATLGVELLEQVPDLDAVIVPVGGGGLCAGVAAAIKQLRPSCAVYGVEPTGADTMWRSFQAGRPVAIDQVQTIADSLGAPTAGAYTYAVCRQYVDDIVRVDDAALRRAMQWLFAGPKFAVEPAAASAVAAAAGPLRARLTGRRVGLVICGTNIDPGTYLKMMLS